MRNRAKCKLCKDIIESIDCYDYITCGCGEISIDGGDQYCRCSAKNWENFIRVDDEGNEIIPKIIEKSHSSKENIIKKPSKTEMIQMLEEMAKKIEELPPIAMTTPITHYDYYSLLLLLSSIFKEDDCKDES